MPARKKATHYRVTGAAVVLHLESKGEQYLYRNAVIPAAGFDEASIERAVDNKLIEPFELGEAESEES